jgi:hypothetical protein
VFFHVVFPFCFFPDLFFSSGLALGFDNPTILAKVGFTAFFGFVFFPYVFFPLVFPSRFFLWHELRYFLPQSAPGQG